MVLALATACDGDDGAPATSTPEPSATDASTSSAATPTADPIGAPEPDGDRVFAVMEHLAVEIGPRTAGTPGEIAARDYLQAELKSYGYDVSIQSFAFDASRFLPATVRYGADAASGLALHGSASGTASGPLVDGGIGRPEEFPPETAGAIAIVLRGTLTLREKVENAVAAGARGVIIINNASGSLIATLQGDVTVPVIGVRNDVGENIRDALQTGAVQTTVEVTPPRGTAYNVVARPAGVTQCTTVTGGHFDSVPVTGGAHDNASGTAVTVEVARLAAANRLPGANCFVLFGAEEFGLLGSAHYVAQLPAAELGAMRAMVNIDVVGAEGAIGLIGSSDLIELARVEGDRAGIETVTGDVPAGAGSDHASFLSAGVPVIFFNQEDNQIHTPADTPARLDAAAFEDAARLAYGTLAAIAGP